MAFPFRELATTWGVSVALYLWKRRKNKMSEIVGVEIGSVGHAGIELKDGKLVLSAGIDGNKIVDLVIDAAEKAIPGDFDKPLLEVVRAAAKAALVKV